MSKVLGDRFNFFIAFEMWGLLLEVWSFKTGGLPCKWPLKTAFTVFPLLCVLSFIVCLLQMWICRTTICRRCQNLCTKWRVYADWTLAITTSRTYLPLLVSVTLILHQLYLLTLTDITVVSSSEMTCLLYCVFAQSAFFICMTNMLCWRENTVWSISCIINVNTR